MTQTAASVLLFTMGTIIRSSRSPEPRYDTRMECLLSLRFAAACCLAASSASFAAQSDPARDYPSKPIRLIVPYSAGGATDITARSIGAKLTEKWGQQVVVDNRTGAGGAIAVEYTANASPDGYTLCLFSASQSTATAAGQKLPYDILRDLAPITQAISLPYVVYHSPSVPVRSVKELIAYAKANPGKISYGTSPEQFGAYMKSEVTKWTRLVKEANLRFQ